MTDYKDIKGASELVNKHQKAFETINTSIKELEAKKEALQGKLDNSDERFTVESIEKNAKTKQEYNLIGQYLKEAYIQKDNLSKESEAKAYLEARKILKEHKANTQFSQNHLNKAIVEHLYSIRALRKELSRLEQEEHRKVASFVDDLKPYMVDEDTFRQKNGGAEHLYILEREVFGYNREIFHAVPEISYRTRGLFKADVDPQANETHLPTASKLNELYKVDVDKVNETAVKQVKK